MKEKKLVHRSQGWKLCGLFLFGVRGTEESGSLLSQSTQTSTNDKSKQRL
jgi:hypothetical protein